MSKNNKWAMDPSFKESIKTKINAQIDKMKIAESKGDNEAMEKIMILKERIRLIDSYRPFDEVRLANLQKIFKHYCTHIFKTGKNMSFDRIEYENQHMKIERFFAFINDFKLNEIPLDETTKQLTHPNNIILMFKKCSSNARNLQFHQFVFCVERVFTLLFNQTENYDRRQQKLLAQKKKRAQQAKKRQKIRELKKNKKINQTEKPQNKQEEEQEQEEQQQEAPQNIKKTQIKNSQIKSSNPQHLLPNKPNEQAINLPKSTENDQMVKQMMKDFQIVNPTDEVKKAVKKIKKGSKKQEQQQDDAQPEILFDPYAITDQQKIQSYMLRMGLDNWKSIQKKLRYFQKANHKYTEKNDPLEEAIKIKNQKLKLLKKDELTHYENASLHQQWKSDKKNLQDSHVKRLLSVKDKIEGIKMQRSKSHLGQSLPKELYQRKKKSIIETFQRKQRQFMVPNALARLTKRKQQLQQSSMNFNLQMISRSTPHHLQLNKINPERYAIPDPTDRIYMQQFGFDSFLGMKRSSRNDIYLGRQTKKRAEQLQNLQEKKMNRLSRNMYKRQQQNRQSLIQRKN